MKEFLRRNKYAALFSYFIIYLIWFGLLEVHADPVFYTHCRLDDLIPFCSWFLIPYLIWFPYVGITMGSHLHQVKAGVLPSVHQAFFWHDGLPDHLYPLPLWPAVAP